ncbi:MAG: hypothetical protein GY903_11510 [Fuerstiella sp.]|nr:hypothetical protein [Fuerstiella sp.]
MYRILPGLALACLVMGCAEDSPLTPTTASPTASPPPASAPETSEAPESPTDDSGVTYTTVSLKVPGMH